MRTRPALAHQTLLQVAADAVKHLELEGVAGEFFRLGKGLGLLHDAFIVRRQAVVKFRSSSGIFISLT